MKGFIGEFEELVLLTIANLGHDAYGASILEQLSKRANRKISLGALHSTLTRLEEKGFLESQLGEPTATRGGRRKRYFTLTGSAVSALSSMKSLRDELWAGANFNLSSR